MIQLLKYLFYGLVSGLSEIIPVSSRGHQSIIMILFGMPQRDPVLDLVAHVAILACVLIICGKDFTSMISQKRAGVLSSGYNGYDRRLILSASLPMIIGLFFYGKGSKFELKPLYLSLFLLINGLILLTPDYMRQSNKSAGQMGPVDSFFIGLSGVASIFPGISRVGTGTWIAIKRGADKERAFNWLLFLTVPSMLAMIILDFIGLFTLGVPGLSLWTLLSYIFAAAATFLGTYIGILLMRFVMYNSGLSLFSYYSIGTSFFTFILYLIAY